VAFEQCTNIAKVRGARSQHVPWLVSPQKSTEVL
jgi:hypothetical protein